MRRGLATVGVLVAVAAVGAPAALATPVIRLTGTSASGYKNLKLAPGTVVDAHAYRITTKDRYGFVLGGGSNLTLTGATAKNTLPDMWLKPMRSVYIGPKPGNGGLFKWRDSTGHGMRVAMTGNTIRVDKVGAWGSLTFPRNGAYRDNVIVWTGRGTYPGKVPAGVQVLTGQAALAHWAAVVADWERRHRR